jgi:hypothetical protein
MGLFKTQSLLIITLDTGIDITTASVRKILFQRPDGTKSFWNATLSGTTKVSYSLILADAIPTAGKWKFQAFVTLNGLDGFGDIVDYEFKNNLL